MIVLLILCLALAHARDSEASDTQLQEARALLTQAKGQDKNQGFAYQATYMRYYEVGDSLLLQGQARVSHKGAELEAAEIVFRRDLDQVEARATLDSLGRVVGRPVLRQGNQTLRGERILYNLSTEQGTILKGKIHRDKGFYAGHLIQTRSSTEFHVHQGSYTTCDADHPHFDFYSPRIKVIAGDMAVARPVYFRIKERRLLWIPFLHILAARRPPVRDFDAEFWATHPSIWGAAKRVGAAQLGLLSRAQRLLGPIPRGRPAAALGLARTRPPQLRRTLPIPRPRQNPVRKPPRGPHGLAQLATRIQAQPRARPRRKLASQRHLPEQQQLCPRQQHQPPRPPQPHPALQPQLHSALARLGQ